MTVRFAVLTDVHLGKDNLIHGGGTIGTAVPGILRKFADQMKRRFKPDFVVSLGDMINNEGPSRDAALVSRFRTLLERVGVPIRFVVGNHDVKNLTDAELRRLLGLKRFYYGFDVGHVRFVALYSYARYRGGVHRADKPAVVIQRAQIEWLRRLLARTRRPVVVFNHYPLDEQDLRRNVYASYFVANPWRAFVVNRSHVRRLFLGRPILTVFTGHLHWRRRHAIRAVPYQSVPSLSELKDGAPGGEWMEVTIEGTRVSCKPGRAR